MLRSLAVRPVGLATAAADGFETAAGFVAVAVAGFGWDKGDANSVRRVLLSLGGPCSSGVRGLDMLDLGLQNA